LTTKQITGSTFLIAPTNGVTFTGEGKLVREATGYEENRRPNIRLRVRRTRADLPGANRLYQ